MIPVLVGLEKNSSSVTVSKPLFIVFEAHCFFVPDPCFIYNLYYI